MSAAFSGPLPAAAQPAPTGLHLVLQPATTVFPSKEFYVARIIDERPSRGAVAWLLMPPTRPGQPAAVHPTDLQGGGMAAIRQFIAQSLPRGTSRRPLTIRLQECRVTETAAPGQPAQVDGRIALKMTLEWQREGETIALTDYRGAARYRRPLNQPAVVEPALRQALTEALRYCHSWVTTQAPTSLKLATGLRLRFTDYRQQTEPDTLFYDPALPLAWADFTAPARTGKYAAAVFPSFSYAGQPRVVQGVLQLNLNLKVFVVRSSSWVAVRDAYNLNHEQRHFDLVKLVAERYKRRLTPERLTLKDYNSILQYEYLVAFQEMNRLQEQYDAETHGGQDTVAQERWNQRIEAELRQYGVGPGSKAGAVAGQESGQ
ncbi:hypothetical protein [Hymenobacter lucidus]|uniref:DUF922 domain-containing protein n=1 Tax=Hymenobacter lucidus TaxID=2880930 RepID=A0ABS8AP58_9BACT|nr:hypothetical protein [Hymenobacter lucidus]MCB2407978.1 hypothetical protein [Hymenobacter lucidus]